MERDSVVPRPALTLQQKRESRAKRVLAGRGMLEAVTFSGLGEGGGASSVAATRPSC